MISRFLLDFRKCSSSVASLAKVDPWKKRLQFAKPHIQRFETPVRKVYYAPEWELKKVEDPDKDIYSPLKNYGMTPEKWEYQNKVVWPPGYVVPETGLPKPPEVYHCIENIHFAPKKMFTSCQFAWRMKVKDALIQLKFKGGKGTLLMADAIEQARNRAQNEFHINNPDDMFVAEAFAIQCAIKKSRKRHARENWNITRHRFINVFVRLEEGEPPGYKSSIPISNGWDKMREYYAYLRSRQIQYSI
ncbi:unnamed protein product [Bursaphelenchus okinawaensis]|uniref:Large ribosomal subunit protein uL22m n=1 Tax=Bursaphelenchus okinawaensis TaxID=465554 RepID=A0A811LK52_9BILA|nr:unnamed protein product [Bursaphelenchus okinawaensis]CAG9125198.1 unnamed protein product [Bursaphelenchus okinawaensis]